MQGRAPALCCWRVRHAACPPLAPTARYTNEPREALKAFNFARKDSKWGVQAILHMVEVRGATHWLAARMECTAHRVAACCPADLLEPRQ